MRPVVVSLVVLTLVASAAGAQDLAPEGAFTINFTSTVVNGEPSIAIGPTGRRASTRAC